MEVPFIQYILPDGRHRETSIECDDETAKKAAAFIESGGRFECEILRTGEVSLTAVKDDDDVEIVLCENALGMRENVRKLVEASQKHIGGAA